MMLCKNCGSENQDGVKFCSQCGAPVEAEVSEPIQTEPVCVHCGGALRPGANFCMFCGKSQVPVNEVAEESAAADNEEPVNVITGAPEKKKSRKGLLIGLIAGAIAAVLAVGVYFMVTAGDDKKSKKPTKTVELNVNEAELVYELTEADVEEFYSLLEECEQVCIDGSDIEKAEALTEQLDEQYTYLEAQYSIAMILYYCDLNDEQASQLYLDSTEITTQANNDYLEMARRVYLSDSPAKDTLFADWTEEELKMLMAYTSEVMELQQRNSEIEVAYQDLQDDPFMNEEMVPLFIETVQNNNRIANIYGYDNFYDYAYEQNYYRDYTAADVEKMRTYVATYLPSAMSNSMSQFYDTMGKLNYLQQSKLFTLLDESYEENTVNYVGNYLAILPEGMQADMLHMFDGNIIMKDSAYGAQEGAFTANIGTERCICYFGPGYSDAYTIIHEVGHYYGATHSYLEDIPLDLAETQSQGNEWLFLAHMKEEVSYDLYRCLVDYRNYSDMATILVSVLVDEFEQQVYTHPDVANLTGEDLDAIMEQVCERYGGIDAIEQMTTNVQDYWRLVVIEQPVYYISYAVSAVAAMDLFTVAQEDFDGAVEIYRKLNENADLDMGFLGNITAAGLKGPFEKDVYQALYERYN